MKVALAFFGIPRSLTFTLKSIEQNIFNIFKKNNIEYDIFFHTYSISGKYINIRTKESLDHFNNEEYKLLNADYIEVDDQDTVIDSINMRLYRTWPDPWNTNYNSVNNFILGQYSKSRVTAMIEKTKTMYDYILFIRPDCYYIDEFNIDLLKSVINNDSMTICIPNNHLYGPYNFNDRFCVANMKTYRLYGNTFNKLLEISKKQSLHSETVLGQLISMYNITVVRIPFRFSRVRCNGEHVDIFL